MFIGTSPVSKNSIFTKYSLWWLWSNFIIFCINCSQRQNIQTIFNILIVDQSESEMQKIASWKFITIDFFIIFFKVIEKNRLLSVQSLLFKWKIKCYILYHIQCKVNRYTNLPFRNGAANFLSFWDICLQFSQSYRKLLSSKWPKTISIHKSMISDS